MTEEETTDYESGYYQAITDIWLLFMEIANSNAQDMEKNIRALIDKFRQANVERLE